MLDRYEVRLGERAMLLMLMMQRMLPRLLRIYCLLANTVPGVAAAGATVVVRRHRVSVGVVQRQGALMLVRCLWWLELNRLVCNNFGALTAIIYVRFLGRRWSENCAFTCVSRL